MTNDQHIIWLLKARDDYLQHAKAWHDKARDRDADADVSPEMAEVTCWLEYAERIDNMIHRLRDDEPAVDQPDVLAHPSPRRRRALDTTP